MILAYILLGMFSTLMLACSVMVVFKHGENELICKYGQEDKSE